jgi:hypothetical protein
MSTAPTFSSCYLSNSSLSGSRMLNGKNPSPRSSQIIDRSNFLQKIEENAKAALEQQKAKALPKNLQSSFLQNMENFRKLEQELDNPKQKPCLNQKQEEPIKLSNEKIKELKANSEILLMEIKEGKKEVEALIVKIERLKAEIAAQRKKE